MTIQEAHERYQSALSSFQQAKTELEQARRTETQRLNGLDEARKEYFAAVKESMSADPEVKRVWEGAAWAKS
jgi:hypothetical protein